MELPNELHQKLATCPHRTVPLNVGSSHFIKKQSCTCDSCKAIQQQLLGTTQTCACIEFGWSGVCRNCEPLQPNSPFFSDLKQLGQRMIQQELEQQLLQQIPTSELCRQLAQQGIQPPNGYAIVYNTASMREKRWIRALQGFYNLAYFHSAFDGQFPVSEVLFAPNLNELHALLSQKTTHFTCWFWRDNRWHYLARVGNAVWSVADELAPQAAAKLLLWVLEQLPLL